jgi:hypothetical protein
VIVPKGKYQYDALYRLLKATGRELAGLNAPTANHLDSASLELNEAAETIRVIRLFLGDVI